MVFGFIALIISGEPRADETPDDGMGEPVIFTETKLKGAFVIDLGAQRGFGWISGPAESVRKLRRMDQSRQLRRQISLTIIQRVPYVGCIFQYPASDRNQARPRYARSRHRHYRGSSDRELSMFLWRNWRVSSWMAFGMPAAIAVSPINRSSEERTADRRIGQPDRSRYSHANRTAARVRSVLPKLYHIEIFDRSPY